MQVYKITNLLNNRIYIGQDSNSNPNYFGSGKLIKQAIKKYGKENFIKEIICECLNKQELDEKEKYWIDKLKSTNREIGYNITIGGSGGVSYGESNGMFGRKHSKKTIEKMKAIKIGKKQSEATKLKMSITRKGKRMGKLNPMYGKIVSESTREKLRIAAKNRIITEETRQKLRIASSGKKHSDETKLKISQKHKGKIPWNKNKKGVAILPPL